MDMEETRDSVMGRLSRIEGQVRGIRKMVESGQPCREVLKQVAAVNGALISMSKVIVDCHLGDCVDRVTSGEMSREDFVDELARVFQRVNR